MPAGTVPAVKLAKQPRGHHGPQSVLSSSEGGSAAQLQPVVTGECEPSVARSSDFLK